MHCPYSSPPIHPITKQLLYSQEPSITHPNAESLIQVPIICALLYCYAICMCFYVVFADYLLEPRQLSDIDPGSDREIGGGVKLRDVVIGLVSAAPLVAVEYVPVTHHPAVIAFVSAIRI